MRRDIDRLMAARELDAILVRGKVLGNPPLIYMLNGAHLTSAILIKKLGETPQLIAGPMDRASAAETGYEVILTTRYDYVALLQEHDGDQLAASVAYYQRIFEDLAVKGRLGVYGYLDQGYAYAFLRALDAATPDVEIVGEIDENLMQAARATKDPDEVARIREVGQRTAAVVRQTLAFLQSHTVGEDEVLRKASGDSLTVGDVHAQINRLIAAQGLEDPEGFIFSTGRDAGIPHSRGSRNAVMRLGQSIVFDIFPREVGGGYFYDLTRTFCLGYAPEPVARLHTAVVDCLTTLIAAIRPGEEARAYQRMTCDLMRERGHPTIADDPSTLRGYVHGIGHGVGLDVHEAPPFFDNASNTVTLAPGHLFAIEPGLYYPDDGMGCRVEDVLWIAEDGTVENLTDMPYDLVVPVG
ncbi:MAG: aminopeptidase P family protein [Anaerolineae bacterium]|nr:aminopeptidase P family protein [Anaerolineae bacterium]